MAGDDTIDGGLGDDHLDGDGGIDQFYPDLGRDPGRYITFKSTAFPSWTTGIMLIDTKNIRTATGSAGHDTFHFVDGREDSTRLIITDFDDAVDTIVFREIERPGSIPLFSSRLIDEIADIDTNRDDLITTADNGWSLQGGGCDLVYETHDGTELIVQGHTFFDAGALEIA